jgi:hypothetical protein
MAFASRTVHHGAMPRSPSSDGVAKPMIDASPRRRGCGVARLLAFVITSSSCSRTADAPMVSAATSRESCRTALSTEAKLLAAVVREDAPEMAQALDGFLDAGIVSQERMAAFADLRSLVQNVAPEGWEDSLKRAEEATSRECGAMAGASARAHPE